MHAFATEYNPQMSALLTSKDNSCTTLLKLWTVIFAKVDLYLGRAVSSGVNVVLLWHIINLVSSETFQVHQKVLKKNNHNIFKCSLFDLFLRQFQMLT